MKIVGKTLSEQSFLCFFKNEKKEKILVKNTPPPHLTSPGPHIHIFQTHKKKKAKQRQERNLCFDCDRIYERKDLKFCCKFMNNIYKENEKRVWVQGPPVKGCAVIFIISFEFLHVLSHFYYFLSLTNSHFRLICEGRKVATNLFIVSIKSVFMSIHPPVLPIRSIKSKLKAIQYFSLNSKQPKYFPFPRSKHLYILDKKVNYPLVQDCKTIPDSGFYSHFRLVFTAGRRADWRSSHS